MAPLTTSGIHHITAISSAANENLEFYEQVLGLRLVKQTVNYDDPFTHHLYYGDAVGTPGTVLTFFPWPRMPAGRTGAGMIAATAFAVPADAMAFWADRLDQAGVATRTEHRLGERVLKFCDPHGLALELIGANDPPAAAAFWEAGPVDPGHAIRGFHAATALVTRLESTQTLLTASMGMTLKAREKNRYRFQMNDPRSMGRYLDVVIEPDAPQGGLGTGTVHHIAFRVPTEKEQVLWQDALRRKGVGVTAVRDRNYFKSIYFHEPGGILFEMATDQPGFTVDEPVRHLGGSLQLPAHYEGMRPEIEAALPPLRSQSCRDRIRPPAARGAPTAPS
jgi:glyoxalase family protein